MACAEGEVVADPGVQKAALLLLCHLLGGPIIRPGCSRHNADRYCTYFSYLLVLVEVSPSRRLGACWKRCCWMRTAFSSPGPSQLFFKSSMLCSVTSWSCFSFDFFSFASDYFHSFFSKQDRTLQRINNLHNLTQSCGSIYYSLQITPFCKKNIHNLLRYFFGNLKLVRINILLQNKVQF